MAVAIDHLWFLILFVLYSNDVVTQLGFRIRWLLNFERMKGVLGKSLVLVCFKVVFSKIYRHRRSKPFFNFLVYQRLRFLVHLGLFSPNSSAPWSIFWKYKWGCSKVMSNEIQDFQTPLNPSPKITLKKYPFERNCHPAINSHPSSVLHHFWSIPNLKFSDSCIAPKVNKISQQNPPSHQKVKKQFLTKIFWHFKIKSKSSTPTAVDNDKCHRQKLSWHCMISPKIIIIKWGMKNKKSQFFYSPNRHASWTCKQ